MSFGGTTPPHPPSGDAYATMQGGASPPSPRLRRNDANHHSNHGGEALTGNTPNSITARPARKALRFWEARETLGLIIAAGIAATIWLPWITGKPTITILEVPALIWIVRALLSPGRPPLL